MYINHVFKNPVLNQPVLHANLTSSFLFFGSILGDLLGIHQNRRTWENDVTMNSANPVPKVIVESED